MRTIRSRAHDRQFAPLLLQGYGQKGSLRVKIVRSSRNTHCDSGYRGSAEMGQKPHLRKVRFWRKADIRETPTSANTGNLPRHRRHAPPPKVGLVSSPLWTTFTSACREAAFSLHL